MSRSDVKGIMSRIKSAEYDSPIAVFLDKENGVKHLNAVFANTVKCQQRIEANDHKLIGVFHREMFVKTVRAKLMAKL